MDKVFSLLVLFIFICSQWKEILAICYFPQEYQGEFVMQSTANVGSGIQYDVLNITPTSIPIWGNCHRRNGNNFILTNYFGETNCIRCLHLKLRSSNVLQVFASSQETLSKCYINEESARTNCPSKESIEAREAAEILLFKTKDALGLDTTKEYCPIDGNFFVTYKGNSLTGINECRGFDSKMDSCPSGSTLNFRFKGCNLSGYVDLKYDCLAHWSGPGNERFLIFNDDRSHAGKRPKYRCALYKTDNKTGKIYMSLSKDSTCATELYNSTNGFETLVLTASNETPWPEDVQMSASMCNFPRWMRGTWEHVRVDEQTITYKDHSSFKTYTIKCVSDAGEENDEEKYLIFTRTQCHEENYNCMKFSKRSNNILEFQLGQNSSKNKDIFSLCSDENFSDDAWITQGRTEVTDGISPGMCPITGEYTGVIPDATELCAKLWSDCRAPELMYYQVSNCETEEVYEEREYRCLGHWQESDLLYTYTQRKDVADGTYECFVGSIISDDEIYIKEAGEHCQRHIDPIRYGMKLNSKGLYSCTTSDTTPKPRPSARPSTARTPYSKIPTTSTLPTTHPTIRQWDFDPSVPEVKGSSSRISTLESFSLILAIVNILLKFL